MDQEHAARIEHFHELTDPWPAASWLITQEGEIVAASAACAGLMGIPAASLRGQHLQKLVADAPEKVNRYLQACARSRNPIPGALTWRSESGGQTKSSCKGCVIAPRQQDAPALVFLRCEPHQAEGNKFIALNKTIEELNASYHKLRQQAETLQLEVQERKRAEQELQKSHERLITVLDSLEAIVYVADMETYELLYHNRYFRDCFGEGVGKKCWQVLQSGQSGPCIFCTNDRLLNKDGEPGDVYKWEFQNTANKNWYYIHDRAIRWLDGRTVRLEIATDITERKRAEEEKSKLEKQMLHMQKLESLGLLAGGIAHDFNNMLMAILGNADLALHQLSPVAPARRNIEAIERASRRAADLCKQMLAYSGKGRFEIKAVNLSSLIEEMTHMLQVSISKKVVLRYNFAADLPAIKADATQIRQVIMNLVINASEAIGEKSGVISISTGTEECDRSYLTGTFLDESLEEGLYAYLEVADTGCGMDAETQARLFDPFFTTKFTGRGLGMAAVLGITRGHRGALKVYSEPGRGTTIKVLFPAAEGQVAGPGKPGRQEQEKEWQGKGTILLVDDDETVRAVGREMLEELGFTVLTAVDGREGVEVFAQQAMDIDCVILDLTMPHMSGAEAFREMRRRRADIRVILSSGYNEQESTEGFAGKGIAGFLQKPYSLTLLKATLQKVFSV